MSCSVTVVILYVKYLSFSGAVVMFCHVCRYSREEPFTALNIEIRNQQNLLESLEQYVKGDLLEGANAYHCEKCSKKVGIYATCLLRVQGMELMQQIYVLCIQGTL